jgi:NAD(P)-dependent dehydrogenase (short-subunit alcohol dehydrogenase family)
MKKTALVTGGSRGIGLAIATQLGLDGFNIAVIGQSHRDERDEQFAGFAEHAIDFQYIQGDIGDLNCHERIVSDTIARFGRIDVLVNNAGVAPNVRNDLLEMSEESYDRVLGVNLKGTMFLTQRVARQMISQACLDEIRGVIVNVTSCSAAVSSTNRGEYCISKAGMSMLTLLYADRLARESILVHEVRPGVIATDMTERVQDKYDHMIQEGVFPIARWGQPEDVAGVVSALCSDKFRYTTGNYIDVDGGFHIRRL